MKMIVIMKKINMKNQKCMNNQKDLGVAKQKVPEKIVVTFPKKSYFK